jgi:signal recognition particle GTPase
MASRHPDDKWSMNVINARGKYPPLRILVSGSKGSGKSTLVGELAVFLKSKNADVRIDGGVHRDGALVRGGYDWKDYAVDISERDITPNEVLQERIVELEGEITNLKMLIDDQCSLPD